MSAVDMQPIGVVSSPFGTKNGTPRQACVCKLARASIRVHKTVFTNPDHSLQGLEEFSHAWVLFHFHENGSSRHVRAKVAPPRLGGKKLGVFATRSPHRPSALGLSLVKIESVKGDTVYFSGCDMIDGTPVLDIKPYISEYDAPSEWVSTAQEDGIEDPTCSLLEKASTASSNGTKNVGDADSSKNDKAIILENSQSGNPTNQFHLAVTNEAASVSNDLHLAVTNEAASVSRGAVGSEDASSLHDVLPLSERSLEHNTLQFDARTSTSYLNPVPSMSPNLREMQQDTASEDKGIDRTTEITSTCMLKAASSSQSTHIPSFTTITPNKTIPHVSTSASTHTTASFLYTSTMSSQEEASSVLVSPDPALHTRHAIADLTPSQGEVLSTAPNPSSSTRQAAWLGHAAPSLRLRFTPHAEEQLRLFCADSALPAYRLRHCPEPREALCSVLAADPRSDYRKRKCTDRLYYCTLDVMHVTAWYDDDACEVLKVQPAVVLS